MSKNINEQLFYFIKCIDLCLHVFNQFIDKSKSHNGNDQKLLKQSIHIIYSDAIQFLYTLKAMLLADLNSKNRLISLFKTSKMFNLIELTSIMLLTTSIHASISSTIKDSPIKSSDVLTTRHVLLLLSLYWSSLVTIYRNHMFSYEETKVMDLLSSIKLIIQQPLISHSYIQLSESFESLVDVCLQTGKLVDLNTSKAIYLLNNICKTPLLYTTSLCIECDMGFGNLITNIISKQSIPDNSMLYLTRSISLQIISLYCEHMSFALLISMNYDEVLPIHIVSRYRSSPNQLINYLTKGNMNMSDYYNNVNVYLPMLLNSQLVDEPISFTLQLIQFLCKNCKTSLAYLTKNDENTLLLSIKYGDIDTSQWLYQSYPILYKSNHTFQYIKSLNDSNSSISTRTTHSSFNDDVSDDNSSISTNYNDGLESLYIAAELFS